MKLNQIQKWNLGFLVFIIVYLLWVLNSYSNL